MACDLSLLAPRRIRRSVSIVLWSLRLPSQRSFRQLEQCSCGQCAHIALAGFGRLDDRFRENVPRPSVLLRFRSRRTAGCYGIPSLVECGDEDADFVRAKCPNFSESYNLLQHGNWPACGGPHWRTRSVSGQEPAGPRERCACVPQYYLARCSSVCSVACIATCLAILSEKAPVKRIIGIRPARRWLRVR
jgi:hypothetical protein